MKNFWPSRHVRQMVYEACSLNTLRFNFRYLPFRQAVHLPIWVSRHVRIRALKGRLYLDNQNNEIQTGLIKIGFDRVGIFDNRRSRTIWEVNGTIRFQGKCFIGHGCKISVAKQAELEFGNDFMCTAQSAFVTVKRISFGEGFTISWDCLIMDTDWHTIVDSAHKTINSPHPISVGSHVWIGCRTTILKGTTLAPGTIVAACSIITKSSTQPNCIIGKIPQQVIKSHITWHR